MTSEDLYFSLKRDIALIHICRVVELSLSTVAPD